MNRVLIHVLRCAIAAGIVSITCAGIPCAVSAQSIAVLVTDTLTTTNRTISGMQSVVREDHPDAVIHLFHVDVDSSANRILTDSLRKFNPDVVVPIGTAATTYAKSNGLPFPIVFAAVLYPGVSGFLKEPDKSRTLTGASLDIPFHIQFEHFQHILPTMRKVGLLYSSVTEALIDPARQSARESNLELITVRVESERGLPNGMDSLLAHCDAIWTLADPVIFTPQGTKFILLQAMKRNIPVMGFSRNVVESGALFALDFDYKAIGRQAGGLVAAFLRGTHPTIRDVTVPDIIWFHYNQKSAEHLGISIPSELMAVAKDVYR